MLEEEKRNTASGNERAPRLEGRCWLIGAEREERNFQLKKARSVRTGRITSSRDFHKVYREGLHVRSRYISVRCLARQDSETRVGFVAGKEIGSAVLRNRAKRVLREAYRLNKDRLKKGYDVVIMARKGIDDLEFAQVQDGLLSNLKKAGLLIN